MSLSSHVSCRPQHAQRLEPNNAVEYTTCEFGVDKRHMMCDEHVRDASWLHVGIVVPTSLSMMEERILADERGLWLFQDVVLCLELQANDFLRQERHLELIRNDKSLNASC